MDSAQMLLTLVQEITKLVEARGAQGRKLDFVSNNGIDYWLGGVHLDGDEAPWRWEEDGQGTTRQTLSRMSFQAVNSHQSPTEVWRLHILAQRKPTTHPTLFRVKKSFDRSCG